ncbi:MAG: 4-hydroxy-tetrahydrodipicolinate reductase [Opitutales bacterium]|nr:4-hydroxy-tetrahydrodipicolinate reductase [Opitutales bacterium]
MINGSRGRMGQAIAACAVESGVHISSQVDAGDDADQFIEIVDVAIDFSHHLATLPLVRTAVAHKKPIVIGTTGHSQADRDAIAELSNEIPMVWAGNFSIGVNLLFHLTSITAKILENGYDAEVLEMHHRLKKDAPSGTAERLLEVIEEAKGLNPDVRTHGRAGITGERTDNEIGVHAVRGGDIVGEHTVFFAGEGERIELTHRASDRRIFAQGALHAAKWVAGKPAGLYNMEDVLGLR